MRTMIAGGGFLPPGFQSERSPNGWDGISRGESRPIYTRGGSDFDPELMQRMDAILRGEAAGDVNAMLQQLTLGIQNFQRTITSSMTAFPVRENLEAPARILIPTATPLRNRIKRQPGAGTAKSWKQLTSLGGGWGVNTTVTTGAPSATQTVGSTAGMAAGDVLYFGTTAVSRIVSSITNATTVVLTATISTTTGETVIKLNFQPGGGSPVRTFFAESGAPAARSSVYANKSIGYKLLGTYGDITGFAMASGANYQDQYATEKRNALLNMMLNEENALINGDSTVTAAPWGDGTNALAFDGLRNLVSSANGVPALSIQTSVGALTFAHIYAQLARIWEQGGEGMLMLLNQQEVQSIDHLFDVAGSTNRVVFAADPTNLIAGRRVVGYVHPVTGEIVDIIVSRFMPPGTMIFGADQLADSSPSLAVEVLPQVRLPELAPNEQVQGYTAQELAPTTAAPQVYPFIISVYEVLVMYAAVVFAKSSGVTAV